MANNGASSSKGKNVAVDNEDGKQVHEKCLFCHQKFTTTKAKLDAHMAACQEKDEAHKAEEARKKAEVEAKLQRKRELAAAQNPQN